MLARTRLKLRNAEKSISFMQDQHAKTLEGLHQEIDKLQKKNARKFSPIIILMIKYDTSRPGVWLYILNTLILDMTHCRFDIPTDNEWWDINRSR